ncbi:MAG: helix-turn-helix transcriptional regulator [Ruminococcus sp.]|nr:helix-turn-helix transcriptional regulator [Ruminococcus sp.]
MSVIGEKTKQYRTEKGYTQEQLGRIIGVTTQAVSKWERGSTPDAEIIPHIAQALGVSIDTLYGREEQSYSVQLARKLCGMPHKEAYEYAFEICWAIQVGLLGDASAVDLFMNSYVNGSFTGNEKTTDHFARLVHDCGLAFTRMSPELDHFFLMRENEDKSILPQLEELSELQKVFALFSDKKLLKILCYIHTLPHMPVATSLICKNTGFTEAEVEKCMKRLCESGIVIHTAIATAEGEINSYRVRAEGYAVPLLCFADEIAKKARPFFGAFERKKPFL